MPPRSLALRLLSLATITSLGMFSSGCELFDSFFDESLSLAEFAPVRANVTFEFAEATRVQIEIEAKDSACPTIRDDVKAEVDGKAMDVFMRGGQKPTSNKDWVCGNPTFRRSVSEADLGAATTRFEVSDETADLLVEATDLLQARTLTPTILDVPIVPGVETSFEWSVATDEIDETLVRVEFVYDDPMLEITSELVPRVDGSSLMVKLPLDAPAGAGKLHVEVTANVPVKTCTGVTTCAASVHAKVQVPLEVGLPVP